jgi:hypothetical protein
VNAYAARINRASLTPPRPLPGARKGLVAVFAALASPKGAPKPAALQPAAHEPALPEPPAAAASPTKTRSKKKAEELSLEAPAEAVVRRRRSQDFGGHARTASGFLLAGESPAKERRKSAGKGRKSVGKGRKSLGKGDM